MTSSRATTAYRLHAQKWLSTEKNQRQDDRDGHHLGNRLAEHLDDFHGHALHIRLFRSGGSERKLLLLAGSRSELA